MSEVLKFDITRAKIAEAKVAMCANEIQNIHNNLSVALGEQSTAWWLGNSKNGYTKRSNHLLTELKMVSQTVEILRNDLLEIVRKKEEEENDAKKQLASIII